MTNQLPLSGTAAEISQGDAVEIAARKIGARPEDLSVICQDGEAAPFKIYNAPTEPCWWILAPHAADRGALTLRSSRVVLVGRRTGVVHYDGSANDEG